MEATRLAGSVYLEKQLLKLGGDVRVEWKMLTAG